jgi:hypothetical protein
MRLINLTRVKFSNDQINAFNLGFDYAIEGTPEHFNTLKTDTKILIRHLNMRIQNTLRYLATRKSNKLRAQIHVTHYIKDTNTI